MEIHFSQSQTFSEPPQQIFEVALLNPDFLIRGVKKHGPIPAVIKVELVGGTEIKVGVIRKVSLSNGGILNEEITALKNGPRWRMSYRQLTGFPFPFSLFSRTAHGEYICEIHGNKTVFTWHATHTLTTPALLPIALLIRCLFVHPMMKSFAEEIGLALSESSAN